MSVHLKSSLWLDMCLEGDRQEWDSLLSKLGTGLIQYF